MQKRDLLILKIIIHIIYYFLLSHMNEDAYMKTIQNLINTFKGLKKADPDGYYADQYDQIFKKMIMKISSGPELNDTNLLNNLEDATKTYRNYQWAWNIPQKSNYGNGYDAQTDEYEYE